MLRSSTSASRLTVWIALVVPLIIPAVLHAGGGSPPKPEAGDLDLSFGTSGRVVTNLESASFGESAEAVVIQPGGKIVVVGSVHRDYGPITSEGSPDNFDFALVRYNTDGSVDTTFGEQGFVFTDFGGGDDHAHAACVQPDGKIVVAGRTEGSAGQGFALARYTVDGALDPAFGSGGLVVPGFANTAYAVTRQPDGKIVAAGFGLFGGGTALAALRVNANGTPDLSFGGGDGEYMTTITHDRADGELHAVDIEPDGRILAAGHVRHYFPDSNRIDVLLFRWTADGFPDETADTNGYTPHSLDVTEWSDRAYAMTVQPDGKIVLAGSAGLEFLVVRLNPDLSRDASFSDDGVFRTRFYDGGGAGEAHALVLQPDGKIVAAGYARSPGADDRFVLVRLHSDGRLDQSFSDDEENGWVATDMVDGYADQAFAVALQIDGKLVVAGAASTYYGHFGVARYLNDRCAATDSFSPEHWNAHLSGVGTGAPAGANPQGQAIFHLRTPSDLRFRLNLANAKNVVSAGIYDATAGGIDTGGGGRGGLAMLYDPRTCVSRNNGLSCDGAITDPAVIRRLKSLVDDGSAVIRVTGGSELSGSIVTSLRECN